jgi:ATP-binding cassette subfamily C (CFTR/MRP) protein 2
MLNVAQVDPASGRILVDGIDITTIGLHDLRSRVVSVQSELLRFARLSQLR